MQQDPNSEVALNPSALPEEIAQVPQQPFISETGSMQASDAQLFRILTENLKPGETIDVNGTF